MEVVHADVSKNWGLMDRFIMGLCDQKTLLVRFELESDMLMALSWDALMIKDSAFKFFCWKNVVDGAYDAVISPVWIALPRLPERYWFPKFLSAMSNSIGRFIRVDLPTMALASPAWCAFVWRLISPRIFPRKLASSIKVFFGKKLYIKICQRIVLIAGCRGTPPVFANGANPQLNTKLVIPPLF